MRRLLRRLRGDPDERWLRRHHEELVARGVLQVGPHTYGRFRVVFHGNDARVLIGSYCSIADWVEFIPGGNHRLDAVSTYPFRLRWNLPDALADGHPWTKGDIVVGHDVWIGQGARVLSGVHIGDGAAVAAGTVVTRDVRPYAVVAGNPARELRRRFDDATVDALEAAAWWELSDDMVVDLVPLLTTGDVHGVLSAVTRLRADGAAQPTGAADASGFDRTSAETRAPFPAGEAQT